RASRLAGGVRPGRRPRRARRGGRGRLPRRLSRHRLRGAALRLRGGDRGRPREPARGHRGQRARGAARQLRQSAVPGAVLLRAVRAGGPHPRRPAHRALRPRVIRRRALLALGAVVLLALAGPLLPPYPLTLVTQALVVAILAMSLDVLLGYTGLPSLGHAAYWGVGAYAVALLATERGVGLAGCAVAGI